MKRSPLKRKSASKKARKPIKKVNRKRKAQAFKDAFGPPGFGDFVRAYGCVVAREHGPGDTKCGGKIDAAHVHGRGPGWKANVVGLCADHHTMGPGSFHHLGSAEAFDERWEIDLDLWAVAIHGKWETLNG